MTVNVVSNATPGAPGAPAVPEAPEAPAPAPAPAAADNNNYSNSNSNNMISSSGTIQSADLRKHIRPRVRNRTKTLPQNNNKNQQQQQQQQLIRTTTDNRQEAQEQQPRQALCGSSSSSLGRSLGKQQQQQQKQQQQEGILKKNPKYSTDRLLEQATVIASAAATTAATTAATSLSAESTANVSLAPDINDDDDDNGTNCLGVPISKDLIVERKVGRRQRKNTTVLQATKTPDATPTGERGGRGESHAIEGYIPRGGRGETTASTTTSQILENNVNDSRRRRKSHELSNAECTHAIMSSSDSTLRPSQVDNNSNEEGLDGKEESDLVFNSLVDLMEKAGTLTHDNDKNNNNNKNNNKVVSFGEEGTVIEADLSFNVMSPEEFSQAMEEQEEGVVVMDNDTSTNPAEDDEPKHDHDDDNGDDDDDESEKENSEEERGEGSFWDLLDDNEEDPEPVYTRSERSFLQLWKALSQWVTPDAVAYVVSLQQQQQRKTQQEQQRKRQEQPGPNGTGIMTPPSPLFNNTPLRSQDWSDVESTRCAGLMSLLQLYLSSCLQNDLHRPLEERRNVEQRLGQLIRLFDYGRSSPKLNANHTRALTCILVQTVVPQYYYYYYNGNGSNDNDNFENHPIPSPPPPPSCHAVGLTMEEHRYLVQSTFSNFQSLD